MRIALVSPPPMHPTSPPLGPACLAAFLKDRAPQFEVRCFDLNLLFYRQLLKLINEEQISINFYDWSKKKSRLRLLEAASLISDHDWPQGELMSYHSAASVFLSFENLFNGFMGEMARKISLGQETPERMVNFYRDLIQPVIDFAPDLFGISVQFSSQLEFSATLLKLCRQHLNIPTVMGGAWCGVVPTPEDLFNFPMSLRAGNELHFFHLKDYLDYLIPGEGETGLLQLCQMLDGKREKPLVANLIYRQGEKTIKNPPSVITDLSSLPVPDFSSFPLQYYFLPRPVLPLQFSRGCPWRRCTFCTHHHSYLLYRQPPVNHCIQILRGLKKQYGCASFSLVDEMIPPRRFLALAEEIVAEGLNITYAAYAKPSDNFSQQTLKTIHHSGCRLLMWGLESANQRVLDLMDKGTRVEDVEKVIVRADNVAISNLLFVLFGFPTETEEEFYNTVAFLKKHKAHIHALSLGTFVLTEGSFVQRQPEQFSIIPGQEPKDPVHRTLSYEVSEGMGAARVEDLFKQELPALNRIGISRRLAGYRDHLLLWTSCNTPHEPGGETTQKIIC